MLLRKNVIAYSYLTFTVFCYLTFPPLPNVSNKFDSCLKIGYLTIQSLGFWPETTT